MEFSEFFALVGGRLELPLHDAGRVAGLNYQTLMNQRQAGHMPFQVVKRGRKLMVSAVALHAYLFPATNDRGRGRPTKVEQLAAKAAGLSVQEYRQQLGHEVQHVAP